ncbi:hypothetical protein G6F57_014277 [Rhizopus arrhizus]|uniref:Uncharacterized protein n=1 Tax=Rhizopus oryzae TaxID=64495 RepID=A0A9P6XK78_RHIOR|nr:hypothetical protein G6F23_012229 [Rhizopus arrhizus]KAG1393062.1 hypothetical protein G6F58_012385 [Rhizopus delemar]KAG0757711.1 hypothetical protein G6F24_010300 [Rhizopus arrhizus]KAG0791835.1 hypothetical protein G6F21_004800 [Rhizopus arrhizus]KAG0801815.1 hypothetical protein G6F22_000872 [Rhizopus arrhizus]
MKIREFEKLLKKTLNEFTKNDCSHFIVWSCEKVQLDKAPCKSTRLCFIIRITQLDPEIGLRDSESSLNEELPNYQDAIHDGPLLLPPPDYVTINQPQSALILPH